MPIASKYYFIWAPPHGFQSHLLVEGFYTLINGVLLVFCSPVQPMWDITIHPLRSQRPNKWCFVLLPNQCETSQSTPFGAQRPCWRSFLPPIDVGLPPNPPPSRPSVLTDTPSLLPPINVGPPPPLGPNVLTGTLPR